MAFKSSIGRKRRKTFEYVIQKVLVYSLVCRLQILPGTKRLGRRLTGNSNVPQISLKLTKVFIHTLCKSNKHTNNRCLEDITRIQYDRHSRRLTQTAPAISVVREYSRVAFPYHHSHCLLGSYSPMAAFTVEWKASHDINI